MSTFSTSQRLNSKVLSFNLVTHNNMLSQKDWQDLDMQRLRKKLFSKKCVRKDKEVQVCLVFCGSGNNTTCLNDRENKQKKKKRGR